MNIGLSSVGTTHYEHQTSVKFTIDGEEYWFTIFATGAETSNDINYDVDNDDDIPFELTQEIKDELIDEYLTNEANFR